MAEVNNKAQAQLTSSGDGNAARLHLSNLENAVTRARLKLSLTQAEFAKLLDSPIGTVRGWEQGRGKPPPCAKLLMRVAMSYPEQVLECAIDAPKLNPSISSQENEKTESEPKQETVTFHHPGDDSDFWLL